MPPDHPVTFASLASATSDELDALMTARPAAQVADVVGFEFRGWNLQKATSILGTRKFIKGFFAGESDAAAWGYNKPVVQNDFDGKWIPKTRDGQEIRYLFFGVVPGSQVPDAVYPDSLVVDYRLWPKNSPLNPLSFTVDYLVLPDPNNHDLLLGKSYSHILGTRLFLGFFLIERLRPTPGTEQLAAPGKETAAPEPPTGHADEADHAAGPVADAASSRKTVRAFIALQLKAIEAAQPDCSQKPQSDDPDAVTDDVFEHLSQLPSLPRFIIDVSIGSIDSTAVRKFDRHFHEIGETDQRRVLDDLAHSLVDAVSLLSRITWLVIYSRDPARDRIGFTLPPDLKPVPLDLPQEPVDLSRSYDVCIIGSGAGGSVVAALLAEYGFDVLIVEEGPWVSPDRYPTRDDKALAQLYRDAGAQFMWPNPSHPTARSSLMTLLQGRLVGGGPAVNNAIHIKMDEARWDAWSRDWDFPLTWEELSHSMDVVGSDLKVAPLDRTSLGERTIAFASGASSTEIGFVVEDLDLSVCDCLGCGGCNVGCRFARKIGGLHGVPEGADPAKYPRSYLMRALNAQKRARVRPRLRALRLEHGLGRHVSSLVCEDLANGNKKIHVRARRYVVAAGAFASSNLLRQSDVGDAGRQFSANVVTSIYGRMQTCFPPGPSKPGERPNPGIQMSLWVRPDDRHNRILETWFHYPGSIAGSLPGWLEDHSTVMAGYGKLAGCGVVIPTANSGRLNGSNLVLGLSKDEFRRMKAGILDVVDALVAAGATEVYPCTTRPFVFHAGTITADKAKYDVQVRGPADLALATSHLQGGNPITRNSARGVVGPDFRAFAFDNVYVADASLFPDGAHVNPQMTVMALARLAAARVMDSLVREPGM